MNLPLDELLRWAARDPGFREEARRAPQEAADRARVPLADLTAVLEGDLSALHRRGGHPLLIMQLAGALGIDPIDRFHSAAPAPIQTERNTARVDRAGSGDA
ncbi:hypothetical protein [Pseudonocardia acidicola]|uniref:hypothetical protein n=1 Tax=Pseudonocardia acidicola TaxID=2724939 RepID=UPI001B7D22C8|nr:hypothetical protein [Pseudonocardia acidicola]